LLEILNQKNSAINSENQKFLNDIKEIIYQRKTKLNVDQEKIKSLVQKIKIPLKQKVVPNETKVHIDAKKFVQLVKPKPRLPEEYFLNESILKEILEYVDNQCKSFEKTPSSYKQLGEEQLRDIILSALNAIFEGDATSETFIKKGKTDIHLKIKKGEILVFECKIWRGEKLYLETIDQLIGYVTWRQNYGVLIIFCKNKDFSKILAQLPNIIQNHKLYVRGYKKLSNTHFVSEHSLPEDTEKIIKIHHLIYNLYSE
jgi:Holliday junction resolvase